MNQPEYPFHDNTLRVTQCGRLCLGNRKIRLSRVSAGQTVEIRVVEDKIRPVDFVKNDLGFFDEAVGRVEPSVNPFIAKHVNHVSGIKRRQCVRY